MQRIPNDLYKKIIENMPICCVDAVVHHDKKVLLVYRTEEPCKDQWWLPGGRILKNEKLEEAVKRKVLEETGLAVSIEKKFGVYEVMWENGPFGGGVHAVSVNFLVRPEEGLKIKLDNTSSGYRWVDEAEGDLHDYVKKVLNDSEVFKKK
ncbi:NUDIX domain-containing protein [Candidatus Woesearchaeota archaeon]|nr:NUDIX domain-containing protein [Candidatus Woesearchaeota archaeon]